ncbi:hypothetical protein Bbelb_104070 [Branchiostoma belcheri]|nr:hypothetical protein Bbelb_104070 [Branchiostoma belcheri]
MCRSSPARRLFQLVVCFSQLVVCFSKRVVCFSSSSVLARRLFQLVVCFSSSSVSASSSSVSASACLFQLVVCFSSSSVYARRLFQLARRLFQLVVCFSKLVVCFSQPVVCLSKLVDCLSSSSVSARPSRQSCSTGEQDLECCYWEITSRNKTHRAINVSPGGYGPRLSSLVVRNTEGQSASQMCHSGISKLQQKFVTEQHQATASPGPPQIKLGGRAKVKLGRALADSDSPLFVDALRDQGSGIWRCQSANFLGYRLAAKDVSAKRANKTGFISTTT